jgi:hypothetical protein
VRGLVKIAGTTKKGQKYVGADVTLYHTCRENKHKLGKREDWVLWQIFISLDVDQIRTKYQIA